MAVKPEIRCGRAVMLTVLAAIAAIAAINSASIAAAFIYNFSYACEEECLEKTGITWNITLHKGAGDTIKLSQIAIVELVNKGTLLGFYDASASPVIIYTKEIFQIKGKLPAFNNATSINVSPCFTTALELSQTVIDDGFIGTQRTYCEKTNHSVQLYQCLTQQHCSGAETCLNNTCSEISCGECQYSANHSCVSYECCGDSQCSPEQECNGNKCSQLECPSGYEAKNHTCSECLENEALVSVSSRCQALNCSDDETAMNHTCTALKCPTHKAAKNHTCSEIELNVELKKIQNSETKATVEIGMIRLTSGLSRLLETALLATILALVILFANTMISTKNNKSKG